MTADLEALCKLANERAEELRLESLGAKECGGRHLLVSVDRAMQDATIMRSLAEVVLKLIAEKGTRM